jgi:hypothetical protein
MANDDKNKINQDEEDDHSGAGGLGGGIAGKLGSQSAHISSVESEDDDQDGEGGLGGATGEIGFRYKDAMSIGPRDDALPPTEIKRLLAIHKEIHKSYVDKQKQARKERRSIKGQQERLKRRAGLGLGTGGGSSRFKAHPISNKAQFSGIDRQVIGLPTENMENTNEAQRNELENRNELRLQNAPRFNPKPRPN